MIILKSRYDRGGKEVNMGEFIQFASSDEVREITQRGVKGDLPMVCVSAVFDGNGITKSNVVGFTGYIGIDVDKKDNPNITDINEDLAAIKDYIVFASKTFSGGYRIVFKVSDTIKNEVNSDLAKFEYVAQSAMQLVENIGLKVDESCRDITRRFFVNYSDEVIVNTDANVLDTLSSIRNCKSTNKAQKSKSTKSTKSERVKKQRNFFIDFDVEKVRVSTNGVKYDHCVYLNVLPLNTFYLKKVTLFKINGKEKVVDFLKVKEGGRNNALCRYLLNRVAYSVFNPTIKLTYPELLNYAKDFDVTYLDEPLPEKQIEETTRSIYGSYINGKITKAYLVNEFGVTYGNKYGKFADSVRIKKVIYFIRKQGRKVTNKEVANYLRVSKRTLQRLLERYFDGKNVINKLDTLVKIILGEAKEVLQKLSSISDELVKHFLELNAFITTKHHLFEKDIGMVT